MSVQDDPTFRKMRAKDAALSRSRTPDDPEYVENRRALTAASIAAEIQKRLAGAPPLTDSQVETLTNLIRSGGAR